MNGEGDDEDERDGSAPDEEAAPEIEISTPDGESASGEREETERDAPDGAGGRSTSTFGDG